MKPKIKAVRAWAVIFKNTLVVPMSSFAIYPTREEARWIAKENGFKVIAVLIKPTKLERKV